MSTQTPAAPFENRYSKRLVAEKDAKPCSMCYRNTATVLTTVANQDFFYICPSHLKDPTFAEVASDESARIEAQRMEAEVAEEREKIVREFEKRAKQEVKKDADVEDKDDSTEDKNREKTLPNEPPRETPPQDPADDEPRIFTLNAQIFTMRLNRLRSLVLQKRAAQLQRQILDFPSVPAGPP